MHITNKPLKRRIIEISFAHKLSHIGSCITAVDIINEIYEKKEKDEKFVLSSGHAGLALYTVIEQFEGINAETIFLHHGVHPDRCASCHLDCSSGSLGNGLPIALGMALSDRSKNVYCLISDGECSEGSIWEAFRICKEQNLTNLHIYINYNGWAAYKEVELGFNFDHLLGINTKTVLTSASEFPFLAGQQGHYHVMTEADYKQALKILT